MPSGVGLPEVTVRKSVGMLVQAGFVLRAASRFFSTPCFPAGSGPGYVNTVVVVQTQNHPEGVIKTLHDIEATFGRERIERWGKRSLDLDLLACNDQIIPDVKTLQYWLNLPLVDQMRTVPDRVILPHPRIQDRAFVLVPMADVVRDWVHPVLGRTVSEMLAALDPAECAQIMPI
ncbi:MAG: 2-amino-4-hydroxy-6-hydroxymethyldihydropteridine diphosphokinase [Rhodobacteraceae bacterium]|nr:2-amino-4-hydroxy-6-hydroxymethyldihydropteridine diphosphokinase [Paracoccaceae bacterium]